MRKIYVLLFMFLIVFSLNHNVFAVNVPEFVSQTTNNTSNITLFLNKITYNASTIVLTIMYFLFVLICFNLFKTNKSKKLMIVYKIVILVLTFLLYIAYKNSIQGLDFYAIHIIFALIEMFIGIFPKSNKTRIILTLIPVVLCAIMLILALLNSPGAFEGDESHEMFHKIENIVMWSEVAIIPEIISQIALAPLYVYYKKENKTNNE